MEESGKTIRDDDPDPPMADPCSWLCDEHDQPVMEYIHDGARRTFRIYVGALAYEHFRENAAGEWLYRRVK